MKRTFISIFNIFSTLSRIFLHLKPKFCKKLEKQCCPDIRSIRIGQSKSESKVLIENYFKWPIDGKNQNHQLRTFARATVIFHCTLLVFKLHLYNARMQFVLVIYITSRTWPLLLITAKIFKRLYVIAIWMIRRQNKTGFKRIRKN